MDYRKECLKLVEEILRETLEQKFTQQSLTNKAIDSELDPDEFGGLSLEKIKLFQSFVKKYTMNVSKAVYHEHIDETMKNIMIDIGSIAAMFTDDELRQIYEATRSPIGRKVLRNLDIIRNAMQDGLLVMGLALVKSWNSDENVKKIQDYFLALHLEE